jgi:co-chaperonin GroES (HSP10)
LIKVVLHRILLKRDTPVDTDAVKTKKDMERLGFAVPDWVAKDIEKQALRENASMDKGVVVDIGETAFKDYGIECPIKVGDYISYVKFGGKDVSDPESGELFTVIQDEDVVAVLTSKKEG